MKPLNDLVRQHLRGLHPYTPGEQPEGEGWIKLNTNELPYSPPVEVMEAITAEFNKLQRYPNPRSQGLREGIASFHGLSSKQVIIGNGSDDILNLLARSFGGSEHRTVESYPSYSLYPVITAISGGSIQSIPLQEDFSLPVQDLLDSNADLLFLTCPNAPSGIRFPQEELRTLAEGCQGILVIDEAYAEFADETALALLAEFPNTVITRTFSKAYGLAGLRVGYALGAPEVIEILDCIRDSYNVNRLSQAGALAALKAHSQYMEYISEVQLTREWVRSALMELGWIVFPSETNFLFGAPTRKGEIETSLAVATSLFRWLEDHQILVRHFPKHPLTAPFLRISIGTKSEMETLINEVRIWRTTASLV